MQDVTVIALFVVIATVLLREQLLATSAVGAVVVGFALQDTLGNFFAGLAIQIEKPFRVGHWVQVGDREGQVQEITWRATKLRTKAGQFLIVPNSVISKEPVLNYSEPTVPTRIEVEVGASYATPPNEVKRAIQEAMANAPLVMKAPEPQVVIKGFGASSIDYLAQFWIEDYAIERTARDQVRTNLWYTFRRHNIEIPYPIQIQYERDEEPIRTERHVAAAADAAGRRRPVRAAQPKRRGAPWRRGAGRAPVRRRRGDRAAGRRGRLDVRGAERPGARGARAVGPGSGGIPAGGFFGEMSMLTGDRAHRDRQGDGRRGGAGDCGRGLSRARAGESRPARSCLDDRQRTRRAGLDDARATRRVDRRARSEAELPGADASSS